jgi:hypothetical protein
MTHLVRLLTSTRSQVCFISETRNSTISGTSLINRFNVVDAIIVPAQGQSGSLWLIWKQDVSLTIVAQSSYYIFALCTNNLDNKQFGLVCLYGDPHHQNTTIIWSQVLHFVVTNSTLPMFCMGDMSDIMHPNEK